ncbi:IS21 family transposase [Puteibacter caeruleilacunae]|nr:IS21 family transposase [Puteibacter caeruleilacunae]
MAGKPKSMSQIKQLLRFCQEGIPKKTIARNLGISKNTVKSYLDKLSSLRIDVADLLAMDDPVLESKFHAGNPAYKDDRFEHLKGKLDYYISELNKTGVTKNLLWEEYITEYPKGYSRSQFCFHLSQHQVASNPSSVLNHVAGEKLYIDFAGKKVSYIDLETGEIIYCQVFIACLPYSDYSYVIAVRSQNIIDFIYALKSSLEYFGGTPKVLVPDNLKSAIIRANKYEPEVNRVLEDFANHYGTTVIPARVRKPKDKALVENQVRLAYTRIYAKLRNRKFFSLKDLNIAITQKNKEHNQTRMQQKPYCREECFLADEKHLLKPLPEHPFELKYYKTLKVAKNNHIYLSVDKHYYSVPYAYIGIKVKVIYTRSMLHIFAKGKQIAVHQRDFKMGAYSTCREHLCSAHNHYFDRSPEYYLKKAKACCNELTELMDMLFKQNKHPEQLYRTCDGLLNLQRKTNPELFKKACKIALEHKVYSYRFLLNVINNKTTDWTQQTNKPALPKHENIRGKAYYSQLTLKFNSYDAN